MLEYKKKLNIVSGKKYYYKKLKYNIFEKLEMLFNFFTNLLLMTENKISPNQQRKFLILNMLTINWWKI